MLTTLSPKILKDHVVLDDLERRRVVKVFQIGSIACPGVIEDDYMVFFLEELLYEVTAKKASALARG